MNENNVCLMLFCFTNRKSRTEIPRYVYKRSELHVYIYMIHSSKYTLRHLVVEQAMRETSVVKEQKISCNYYIIQMKI